MIVNGASAEYLSDTNSNSDWTIWDNDCFGRFFLNIWFITMLLKCDTSISVKFV